MAFEFAGEYTIPERFWGDPDYFQKRIRALETALRLVMESSQEMDGATEAELEQLLECGDPVMERQANAFLVARAALSQEF